MTNIEKGVQITGKSAKYLKNNMCVIEARIIPPMPCIEDCVECWHSEFIGVFPECFNECTCEVCEKYEKTCCLNKTDACKGKCIMRLT